MSTSRKKAYIALTINMIVWGAALPIAKLAFPYTTPFKWLFFRYIFTAPFAIALLLYYILYRFKPTLKQLFTIIGLELFGTTVVLAVLYQGLKLTSALDASIIMATRPILVILAGILLLSEHEEKREWTGLAIALFGTFVITIEPIFNGITNGSHSSIAGNTIIIIGNIVWAGYLAVAKKRYKNIPKPFITAVGFLIGLVSFGILSFALTPSYIFADLGQPQVLFAVIYMAVFGSIIGTTTYLYGQNLIEISEATMFTYLEPIISVPMAILLLADVLKFSTIIGIIIISIGVYLAERRPSRV